MLLIFKCIDVYAGMTCHYPLFTESYLITFMTCILCMPDRAPPRPRVKQAVYRYARGLNHNLASVTSGPRQFTDAMTFCLCIAMNMCITFCQIPKGMEATI